MPNRLFAARPAARAARALLPALLLSAPTLSSSAQPEPDVPPAFELLERVRARYGGLEAYAGSGELEVRRGPGEGEPAGRFELSTVKGEDGSFRLELEEEAADREPRTFLLWGDGEETFVYDSARGREGEYRAAASPLAALAELPGGRELGVEAFPLSALLLGGEGALPRPPAASIDGPEPCPGTPDAPCWRLSHPSPDGQVETVLWVETGEPVVRRAEVRTVADPLGLAAAAADAGLEPELGAADGEEEQVVVRTALTEDAISSFGVTLRLALGAPERARRVERWGPERGGPRATFGETIDVSLAGFVVRVLDSRGRPVTGLGPDDFLVFAGDREVPVRSVDFYARGSGRLAPPGRPRAGAAEAGPGEPPSQPTEAPPKIVVLYVQADFNGLRVRGHLKMLPYVERFLGALPPDDLVAVVSFDSHLEPWLDLTTDREAAQEAVWRAIHFGADPPSGRRMEVRRGPSLFAEIDPDEAADAAWAEKGLEIVGRALGRLPGEKAVVFLGWGLGRYGSGGVTMRRDYRPAVEALTDARASVFVLDVADATYHDLEVGLRRVAAETGGTYEKTYEFPIQATRRLAALLASHYVVTVDVADLPPAAREGRQELEVQLVGHDGVRLLVRPLSGG